MGFIYRLTEDIYVDIYGPGKEWQESACHPANPGNDQYNTTNLQKEDYLGGLYCHPHPATPLPLLAMNGKGVEGQKEDFFGGGNGWQRGNGWERVAMWQKIKGRKSG